MFNVNSPFTALSDYMYSPQQTAAKNSMDIASLGRNYNVRTQAKQQASNGGHFGNVMAMLSGQAGYDAMRNATPLANAMADKTANASWLLKKQNANEEAGLSGMGNMMNAYNTYTGPLGQALASNQLGFLNNLLGGGGLFGNVTY